MNRGACIKIGDNTGISGTSICAILGVEIGNNVLIGANVIISDNDFHPLNWASRLICSKIESNLAKKVIIKDNVFIGTSCIILKGVTINKNSVIGAGSVVVNDVEEGCIYAGNPARLIRYI